MRCLELGSYVVPSYAGMILAEQGVEVVKWWRPDDPILTSRDGDQLWEWLQHGKRLEQRTLADVTAENLRHFDIVIDNIRPSTLKRHGIDPDALARDSGVVWTSMRADVGDTSFDLLAQARSWMEYAPWIPFWIGDTVGGLWLAFKALAARLQCPWFPGHHVVTQAACMQKLVEGELVLDPPRYRDRVHWETERYRAVDDPRDGRGVEVDFRGRTYREPVRDRAWKLANLRHVDGRIII